MAKAACAAFLGAVFALCTSPAAAQSTVRVSVSSDGIEGNEGSFAPSISADGRFVAFWTDATTLVDKLPWPEREVLVHDRYTGRTERISVANDGTPAQSGRSVDPAISADGRFVAFSSNAANLIPYPYPGHYPPNLVYIRDRHNAVTSLVSSPITGGVEGLSYAPSISRDGRYVAFLSTAHNLVAGYTGGTAYVRDLQAAVTTQIDIDREGHGSDRSYALALSADGRFAAFLSSSSALVSDDTNGSPDVFVRDLSAGTTTRVSIASDGTQANWGAEGTVSISADGRYVAFVSKATNLVAGPPNSPRQLVYVHDRQTGITNCVSVASDLATLPEDSAQPSISADGRYVAFTSWSSNLVNDDGNSSADVFVHDQSTGVTVRVSRAADGAESRFGASSLPSISSDGQFVAFVSDAPGLVGGDTNQRPDIFVRARGRVPVDFDWDGRTDVAVFRPSTGIWLVRNSSPAPNVWQWGGPGDLPVPADYDADGTTDVAVYRSTTGEWFIRESARGTGRVAVWGAPSNDDVPVPGDYDGDGRTDLAVYRRSSGAWFIHQSASGFLRYMEWGAPALGDIPIPADYDGDQRTDIAVYRGLTGEWFVLRSATPVLVHVHWGSPPLEDVPVPADYDGDGAADIAVYRRTTGTWLIHQSATLTAREVSWGAALIDEPAPADYDGDGRADVCVFRPATGLWFVSGSATGSTGPIQWGNGLDDRLVSR